LNTNIKYDDVLKQFYIEEVLSDLTFRTQVYLTDPEYFCNKSWTLSYNVNTKSWISFHSYIPNFYIAENNFFYSGINGCCDDFDLVAGEIVPTPSTTTTTTTVRITTTTTSTTAIPLDCIIDGRVVITDCTLEGTGVITVPPAPKPCVRPTKLKPYTLITGYNIIAPPSTVVSTGSQLDACDAVAYTTTYADWTYTSIVGIASTLSLGQLIYEDNGTTDCSVIPDGWYFTQESQSVGFVFQIEGGIIVSIEDCITPIIGT
jgi:hypothetical protein